REFRRVLFRSVTSRVLPPPRLRSTHDQVLSGLRHSSHSFCTKLSTVQAVRSDGVGDIDTHWPTSSCCSLGSISRRLGCAKLSRTCANQGHTAAGGAASVFARMGRNWGAGSTSSPGIGVATSASVARRCQDRYSGAVRKRGRSPPRGLSGEQARGPLISSLGGQTRRAVQR